MQNSLGVAEGEFTVCDVLVQSIDRAGGNPITFRFLIQGRPYKAEDDLL